MQKRITIKDIAKKLNVHHSTVSRALRNDSVVKEETRKMVMDVAKKYGYQVNLNAVHLRENFNNTIALIVPNIRHAFFTDIVSHIAAKAHSNGFVVSIFESNEDFEQECKIINTIIGYNFSGVIASIATNTINSDHFKLLRQYGIPLVFFDRVCEDISTPMVVVNNYESTFNATQLLIDNGRSKIAHITGSVHLNVFRDRQQGYIDALAKNKMGYHNYLIINKEFTIEDGKKAFVRLLEAGQPDAIITSSSLLSIGALLKAKELGFQIPKEIALIGFGDNEMMEILDPHITSIIQPEEEIADKCYEQIIKMIKKEIPLGSSIINKVKTKIVLRESV